MKFEYGVERRFLVDTPEQAVMLEKLLESMPIEIDHPIIRDSNIKDCVVGIDRGEEYGFIVYLDLYNERTCTAGKLEKFYRPYLKRTCTAGKLEGFCRYVEGIRTSLDGRLLKKMIKPAGENVIIEPDGDGYVITYCEDGQEKNAWIRFWDGVL